MRWNCRSKALRFLQITAKNKDFPFLTVFLIIKTSLQNISITLLRVLLKLHEHRGERIGEKSFCERFCKVPVPRIIAEVKQVMDSFRSYDNSDVIATLVMTNFRLNTTVVAIFPNVCLWRRSLCSDLVLTLKNCVEPPPYARTAYVVAIWPSFLFDSFVKIWATCEMFLNKWFTSPPPQHFPYAYVRNLFFEFAVKKRLKVLWVPETFLARFPVSVKFL